MSYSRGSDKERLARLEEFMDKWSFKLGTLWIEREIKIKQAEIDTIRNRGYVDGFAAGKLAVESEK